METNNVFTKTPVTSIDDTHGVIISKSTGAPDIVLWSSIKTLLTTLFDSLYMKLTGNQTIAGTKTFSSTIAGSITGNAATVTNGIYKDGSVAFTQKQTFNQAGVNIPDYTGTLPSSSSDPIGTVGDILYYRKDVYRKTDSNGWIKNGNTF